MIFLVNFFTELITGNEHVKIFTLSEKKIKHLATIQF